MLLVLDTSVILKWFKEEVYSDIALKIKKEFVDELHEIIVPDLLLYEFVNAMKYSRLFNEETIKESLSNLIDLDIHIVIPTEEMLSEAIELSYSYNITIYDAVFLSLAKLINAIFVTADEKLYKKVKELKFVKFIADFR